jgi:outer membrane protein
MKTKVIDRLLYTLASVFLFLQTTSVSSQTLEEYISQGLSNNLAVQQKLNDYTKATYALKEAKALFQPRVDFNATFVTGDGGRFFNIPVGDLLNPVYTTLNAITQMELFPQIENVNQNFFPSNQHDVKVRTSVALYNSDLFHNRDIQTQQVELRTIEIDRYKRELVKQIKQAYYQYLMTRESIRIYESALTLVERSLSVNESLLEAGKAVPAQVLRSKSELEQVRSQLNKAQKQSENAKAYFNFLINKPLDTPIVEVFNAPDALRQLSDQSVPEGREREELRLLMTGRSIYESQLKMQQQFRLPKLGAFVDLGSQAEDFNFNRQSLYYFVGMQMDIPLYQRPQKFKQQQVKSDIRNTELQLEYTRKQIDLGILAARNDQISAQRNYESSLLQVETAASYYRLIERGYKEGIYTLIELIDARNQLTLSEIQLNINTYQILIQAAEVERQAATYPLK